MIYACVVRKPRSHADLLSELSSTIDQLASLATQIAESARPIPINRVPAASIALVEEIISARGARAEYFGAKLFSDPAWDILIHLYLTDAVGQRAPLKDLGETMGIPPTTVLSWLTRLEREGLISRERGPDDMRRLFVRLTVEGAARMEAYLATVRLEAARP